MLSTLVIMTWLVGVLMGVVGTTAVWCYLDGRDIKRLEESKRRKLQNHADMDTAIALVTDATDENSLNYQN